MMMGFDSPDLIPPPDLGDVQIPTDPDELAEINAQIAVTKALASHEEIAWLIRESGVLPELWNDPITWDAHSYHAGLAVQCRAGGPPFHWKWDSIRRINRVDEKTGWEAEYWERTRRAMERLASPNWRP